MGDLEHNDPHALALALAPTLTARAVALLRDAASEEGLYVPIHGPSWPIAGELRDLGVICWGPLGDECHRATPLGAAVLAALDAPTSAPEQAATPTLARWTDHDGDTLTLCPSVLHNGLVSIKLDSKGRGSMSFATTAESRREIAAALVGEQAAPSQAPHPLPTAHAPRIGDTVKRAHAKHSVLQDELGRVVRFSEVDQYGVSWDDRDVSDGYSASDLRVVSDRLDRGIATLRALIRDQANTPWREGVEWAIEKLEAAR